MSAIKPAKCSVCDQWRAESAVMRLQLAETWEVIVCDQCVSKHEGRSGRFEGLSGEHLAFALYADSHPEDADNWCGDEETLHQFGRWLFTISYQGFRDVEECRDVGQATKRFDSLYSDGMGATEFDAYVSDSGWRGYEVSFEGKHLGTFKRESRALAAVSLQARRTGYFPSCWYVNDHGNVSELRYW